MIRIITHLIIILLTLILGVNCELYNPFTHVNNVSDVISYIAICMVFAALLQGLNKTQIPCTFYILVFGMLLGSLCYANQYFRDLTRISETPPGDIVGLILPATLFKTAFFIDVHTFMRSWIQILIISILGLLVNTLLIGFLVYIVVPFSVGYSEVMIIGTLLSIIYPLDIIKTLKDLGYRTRHIASLLEGETIIELAVCYYIFRCSVTVMRYHTLDPLYIVYFLIYSLSISIVFGLIMGKLTCIAVRNRRNNALNVVMWTLSTPYLAYYVSRIYLCGSGEICVIIIGLYMASERPGFTAEVDRAMTMFWQIFSYTLDCVLVFTLGVIFVKDLLRFLDPSHYTLMLTMYVAAAVARLLTLLLLAPMLSRIQYGFTFSEMLIMVLSGVRSPICCLLASEGLNNFYGDFGITLFSHTYGVYVLSLLINSPTIMIWLRALHVASVTASRRANLQNCLKYVMAKRHSCIALLKMDRFLSDANWPAVQKATLIKYLNKNEKEGEKKDSSFEETDILYGTRRTICPICQKEVAAAPTRKEQQEMMKEANLRILKAMKASFLSQYESGFLSKEAIRVIVAAIELAIDSSTTWLDLDQMEKLFSKSTTIYSLRRKFLLFFFRTRETKVKRPKLKCRAFCYDVVTNFYFALFIAIIVILNIIPIVTELVVHPATDGPVGITIIVLNLVTCIIYLVEFTMKICGYSYRYFSDGFVTYFRSAWNWFDMLGLIASLFDIVLDYMDLLVHSFLKPHYSFSKVVLLSRAFRLVRFFRLLRWCRLLSPNVVKWCDSRIDFHIAFAYEIGKSFVVATEDILEALPNFIDNEEIRKQTRKKIINDKLRITKELGIVQKERPWISVTVKSKEAMRSILNTLEEMIYDLKLHGWVDDFEFMKLEDKLNEKVKNVKDLKSVQPIDPRLLFNEVPWMINKEPGLTFLFENVITKVYEAGDTLCDAGEMNEGILIVITGFLKHTYTPNEKVLKTLKNNGFLPVVDYLSSTNFSLQMEDYIISGNTIGEMCFLTGRPYNSAIVAISPVQLFILTKDVMQQALNDCSDPIFGLKARLWKFVSFKLAYLILKGVPAYQSLSVAKLSDCLVRAFVPNLMNFRIFALNQLIEDIILIEGIVSDYNTHELYFAPCYLPRTIKKIIFVSTAVDCISGIIFFIIPIKNADEYEVMAASQEGSTLEEGSKRLYARRRRFGMKKHVSSKSNSLSSGRVSSRMDQDMLSIITERELNTTDLAGSIYGRQFSSTTKWSKGIMTPNMRTSKSSNGSSLNTRHFILTERTRIPTITEETEDVSIISEKSDEKQQNYSMSRRK